MEDEVKKVIADAESAMKKSIEHYEATLSKIRVGRASPAMLDSLTVDYYGSQTPVNQVATVSAPDAKTLTIQPFEKKSITAIEKAIIDSNLGVTPQNDGIIIRINLPPLSEERRKQFVKQVKEESEDARVAVRNLRRDYNEQLKKLSKKGVSEDACKAGEGDIQKLTNKYIEHIDKASTQKEAEIMKV
jgi:ribosome recycling factor